MIGGYLTSKILNKFLDLREITILDMSTNEEFDIILRVYPTKVTDIKDGDE